MARGGYMRDMRVVILTSIFSVNEILIINQMLTVQRMSEASMEDNSTMVQPREIYMGNKELT